MKRKLIRMEKKPGIAVLKLLNATQLKIITSGAYAVGEGLELKFRARVRLDDCRGCGDDNEKIWHARILELYPEGGSKCQIEAIDTSNPLTPVNSRTALKDQIREKIRLRRKETQHLMKQKSPSDSESRNTPPPASPAKTK